MTDRIFIYFIIGLVILHFIAAVIFLIYKIIKAPKNTGNVQESPEKEEVDYL